jgi:outer membrane lipoprotein SlyB
VLGVRGGAEGVAGGSRVGATAGAVVGAIVGAIVGKISCEETNDDCEIQRENDWSVCRMLPDRRARAR